MDQQKIGAFLKELRRERGLTQEDLAEEVWVARRTVSRWETGRSLPDLDLLPRLADLYQVDLRELLDGQRQAAVPVGDVVAQVAEYGAAEKRQTVRLARAYFVAGRRCGQRAAGTDAERLRPVITAENGAGRHPSNPGKTA